MRGGMVGRGRGQTIILIQKQSGRNPAGMMGRRMLFFFLQLVEIVREVGERLLEPLPLLGLLANLEGLALLLERVAGHDLPVVEHALREGLAAGVGAQVGGEAEGLVDGQVGLDVEHGGAGHLGLLEDVTAAAVQHAVDAADGVLGALEKA